MVILNTQICESSDRLQSLIYIIFDTAPYDLSDKAVDEIWYPRLTMREFAKIEGWNKG